MTRPSPDGSLSSPPSPPLSRRTTPGGAGVLPAETYGLASRKCGAHDGKLTWPQKGRPFSGSAAAIIVHANTETIASSLKRTPIRRGAFCYRSGPMLTIDQKFGAEGLTFDD